MANLIGRNFSVASIDAEKSFIGSGPRHKVATQKLISSSYGTFSFWTAFMKAGGDVIYATGFSKAPTFIELHIRSSRLPWTPLDDPCFEKNSTGVFQQKESCY